MTDPLSLTFSALADPTRRAMLLRLVQGEATVNELAAPFNLKLPTVSKHLKVLQHAGLVSQGRKAQWRPCRLEAAPLKEVAEWAERFRANWEDRFQQLDAYLEELRGHPPQHPPEEQDHGSHRKPNRDD
ncbi:MAG TPA: metalloregulator ArsR/SmtB family transcription factor [Myxococcaceae bacterium]|nr:metalloregulator ArsR/SmtB family transcription factor [Myxococcaceae bacterium]